MMPTRSLPKIDDIRNPPIVGETYMVPSVRRGSVCVPVFGEAHTDVELGQPKLHLHVDVRFIAGGDAKSVGVDIAACDVPEVFIGPVKFTIPAIMSWPGDAVEYMAMECLRESPSYQSPRIVKEPGVTHYTYLSVASVEQTGYIEDLCENECVTDCGRCPHRGTPLGHQPVVDGVVVCPSHLLKWDKETGKMIRKTKKVADGTYIQV